MTWPRMAFDMRDEGWLALEMPPDAKHDRMRAVIPAAAEEVRAFLCLMTQGPLARSLPDSQRASLEIVLAEVLNNIVEHAYATTPGKICISLSKAPDGIRCEIRDCGFPMPGLQLPLGQLKDMQDIADLPEGGFGWFLIRSQTKDLIYARQNDENHLSFLLPDEQSPA